MAWLPTRLPPHCKIVVSCVYEPENPDISKDYQTLRRMIDDDNNFINVSALGEELASQVIRQGFFFYIFNVYDINCSSMHLLK